MDISLKNNKELYNTLKNLAIPAIIQNLLMSSLNMIDTLMIGRLGEVPLASVGMANQVYFLFWMCLFGFSSGSSVFTAQFWGKKDINNIKKIFGINLSVNMVISFIFWILCFFSTKLVMSFFTSDIEVINSGYSYLKIVSFAFLFTGINITISFSLRNTEQIKTSMKISSISLITNTVLNYILIYGKLGISPMGVKGAALATFIARIIETLIFIYFLRKSQNIIIGSWNTMFKWSKEFINRYFTTTTPVVFNEIFWALGMTTFSAIFGRMGTSAFAAVQISTTVKNLFATFSRSIGGAGLIMIGKEVGQNNKDRAFEIAYKLAIITIIIGSILGILLIPLRSTILKLFTLTEIGYSYSMKVLLVYSLTIWLSSYNGFQIVGIFRGGGDTKYSMFLEIGTMWLVGVPIALLGAFVLKVPIYILALLITTEEIVKAIIALPRIKSGKWIKNVVDDI